MTKRRLQILAPVLSLAVVLIVAGGGVALATHSNPNEIHACYNNSGHLVIADDPADCGNNETAVSWNQQGPQGPAGPAGPAGGLSNFEIVYTTSPLASDPFVAINLPCPAGKQVISGGFDIQSPGGGVIEIVTSGPYNFGWGVRARASANFQNNPWQLAVTALCATVTP